VRCPGGRRSDGEGLLLLGSRDLLGALTGVPVCVCVLACMFCVCLCACVVCVCWYLWMRVCMCVCACVLFMV
jgi:hypothetical protein